MMIRSQVPQRKGFFFRGVKNPFKILFPKNNKMRLSPKLLSLLNNFETNLTVSFQELIPKEKNDDFITVSWMIQAIQSLCETHKSIKTLITDLKLLPISEFEEKLIHSYSEVSLKVLELCNAFLSELDRLNHGNLLLKFAFNSDESSLLLSQLECWNQLMVFKNSRIENCGIILNSLVESKNHHQKAKNAKEKVLLRALYGVKVKTLYILGVFASLFSRSSKNMFFLTTGPKELPWREAFMELQNVINPKIKNAVLSNRFTFIIKDLEGVESDVKKLLEGSEVSVERLKESVMEVSEKIDFVSKEIHVLVKIVISTRDALFERLWMKYAEEFGVKLPKMIKCV